MKKIVLYILISYCTGAVAADGLHKAGARSAGMGNASLTSKDVWAMFHNPAGLAFITHTEAGISYEQRFSLKELATNALAVGIPLGKTGTIGVNATYFGFKNYNEQQAGLAYAKRFTNKTSTAIKLNYQSFHIGDEYGTRSVFTAEAGLQTMIVRNLWLAGYIYNPAKAKIADEPKEQLPSLISFGAGYLFSDKLNIQVAAEKNSDYKGRFRSGIEYMPVKQLRLRAGIATQPFESSFGFGLELNTFHFDFAAAFHEQLGFTPHLSLGYRFGKD